MHFRYSFLRVQPINKFNILHPCKNAAPARISLKCTQKNSRLFWKRQEFSFTDRPRRPGYFQGTERGGPDERAARRSEMEPQAVSMPSGALRPGRSFGLHRPGGGLCQTVSLAMAIMSAMVSGSAAIAA